jgi:hypothetical protein
MRLPCIVGQQFQIQNVAKDTKSLKCLRSRGLMPIFRINVMLYLVIDQVCLQVTDYWCQLKPKCLLTKD